MCTCCHFIRFLHDSPKGFKLPIEKESISVDTSLNSTYQTREQLHLAPCETESQNVPPPLPARHKKSMASSNAKSSTNNHVVQDNPTEPDCGNFRQRTAAVISSADGKKYKTKYRKPNDSDTPAVPLLCHNQNSFNADDASNQNDRLHEPPPLPPKPIGSRKLHAKKGTSSCCFKTTTVNIATTECSSLPEERTLSQRLREQSRLVSYVTSYIY